MPGSARLDAPGVLHHVIIRGIERRKIFIDNKNCNDFLARLAVLLPETTPTFYFKKEKISRQQELKNKGYDIKKVAERVATIYAMDSRDIMSKGRQQQRVVAESLLCYWSVRELGMSLSELAGLLGMSSPGVGYAVQRGETIARDNDYQLIG